MSIEYTVALSCNINIFYALSLFINHRRHTKMNGFGAGMCTPTDDKHFDSSASANILLDAIISNHMQ